MDFLELLRNYTALVSIAHHIPGRIRLKLNANISELRRMESSGIGSEHFGSALNAVPGIRNVHVNRVARSITVEYDDKTIPDRAWPDLLANRPSPEATALLNCLQDEFRRILEKR